MKDKLYESSRRKPGWRFTAGCEYEKHEIYEKIEKIVHESEKSVLVEAGAGMNWHQFVLKCLDLNFGGIENLSLIPGNVGASPCKI